MAKLGFVLPDELERRLRVFVPWGKKQHLIEGLVRLVVEDLERDDKRLYEQAMRAYHQ